MTLVVVNNIPYAIHFFLLNCAPIIIGLEMQS